MKEVCTIEGKVWSINELSRARFDRYEPTLAWSYLFFDPFTGEIWGKRAVIEGRTQWITQQRARGSMDLTLMLENFDDDTPPGLLCALVVAAGEKLLALNGGLMTASNQAEMSKREMMQIVAGCVIKLEKVE